MNNTEKYSLKNLIEFTKETVDSYLSSDIQDRGANIFDREKTKRRKAALIEQSKVCGRGSVNAKEFIKAYILEVLTQQYGLNEETVNYVYRFEDMESMTSEQKFEVLMHKYKQVYGNKALSKLLDKYNLAELKPADEIDGRRYFIDDNDIKRCFNLELNDRSNPLVLTYKDKLYIVVQAVYARYKGLAEIDDIRDMAIDGISIGVSGLTSYSTIGRDNDLSKFREEFQKLPKYYESIWLYYHGKEVYLKFLKFKGKSELERVCRIAHTFNNPGSFSQSDGFIVNTTYDDCRVVALRDPFAECWCLILRKFDNKADVHSFCTATNGDLVEKFMDFEMKCKQTTAVTGVQGAGKTTLMKGMLRFISPTLTLRIREMFFELHARNLFPERNIISVQDTEYVNGNAALGIIKKTNGAVTIIGEAADDIDIQYIIKAASVASEFTIFSHHANNFRALINESRNALMSGGLFGSEKAAELAVIGCYDFNDHINKTPGGFRYIERVTECIPIVEKEFDYDGLDTTDSFLELFRVFARNMTIWAEKDTTPKLYEGVNIIEYDEVTNSYTFPNKLSFERKVRMVKALRDDEREEFIELCDQMYGYDEEIRKIVKLASNTEEKFSGIEEQEDELQDSDRIFSTDSDIQNGLEPSLGV